ncbi:DUF4192 family protein [Microbacterium sp. C7(2022)]|uniref:DUF4192 family protein n=1 Tax=Microbacterium sp. C7(2022) TaxID=2992759 RepID=UPI00237AFE42|nr:DUF4192 family protein [Microbacterium sp. C7(2022)]MDE0545187.1 DUF4192 domain-containing protein [Microbacterium sp. C7(2022)]
MTTIITAADAAQFLSYVPQLVGCTPTESLVLVPLSRDRSMGAMRFDLPAKEDTTAADDTVERFASTVLGMVCRLAEATAFTAVVYTAAQFDETGRMPHRELLEALAVRADSAGLRVTDLLCVAADGWASACDHDGQVGVRALEEISSREDAAPGQPLGDQTSGADLPEIEPAELEHVERALTSMRTVFRVLAGAHDDEVEGPGWDDAASARDVGDARDADDAGHARDVGDADDDLRSGELRIDPQAIAAIARIDDVPELYEKALGWTGREGGAYDIAILGWCLSRPSMRDVALVQWSGDFDDGDDALDAQLRWESGEEYPTHLAMRMWGEGPQPDPARLMRALEVTKRVAASMPRAMQAGSLAMCAWLSWALGRSTHAEIYASRACEIEPEHGLSEIVRSFVGAGHLPEWAFHSARTRATGSC